MAVLSGVSACGESEGPRSDTKRDLDFELIDELASFITNLHASEINGEISWFYDNVSGAKIGDKLNGYLADRAEFPSLGQAARWLCDRALEFYPESEFAEDRAYRVGAAGRACRSG